MRTSVMLSRRSGRLGVVLALVAGLVTVLPATAQAAGTQTFDTWHMDETSGTSMVDSTGSHNGKLTNVDLGGAGDPAFPGTGYHFNGKSSKVTIPNAADLNPGTNEVHIAFSMRTTSVPKTLDYDLVRKGVAGQQQFKVEEQQTGQVSCSFTGSSGTILVQKGPDVSDGAWHSVGCERFSSSVKLTVDGTSYSSKKSVGSISNPADIIVASHGSGEFFPGDLDELTYIVGSASSVPPNASFTASPTSGKAPLKVSFKDTSTNSPSKWAWDFGDGSTSSSQSPSHTYDSPDDYTVTLTVTNGAGSDTATASISVADQDDKPPTGTFSIGPAAGWAKSTRVTITQTSIGDNVTPPGSIRRVVDWKDGSGATTWTTGTTTSHVYARTGSYAPTVTLTDQAGNNTTVTVAAVTVRADASRPTVGLSRPGARTSVAAWRVLKGRVGDSGSGPSWVHLRIVEKRGGAWYAYRPASHAWVKSGSRAAALHKSRAVRAVLVGASRWSFALPGLHKGKLVMRLIAADRAGNNSRTATYGQLLTRR
jgi:PKD repeat protein